MKRVIDPQIAAVFDDGHEAGAIRAAIVRGELVQHPFIEGQYSLSFPGGGSGATFASGGHADNNDGLGGLVRMASTQGLPTNINSGVRLLFLFYGRVLGIRFRRNVNTPAEFTVSVDGQAVRVDGSIKDAVMTCPTADGDGIVITHQNLSEGMHYAWITLTGIASGSRGLELFGYVVEPRSGYKPHGRQLGLLYPAAVPTVATNIPMNATALTGEPRRFAGVRGIIYTNTTAGALVATISVNGVTIWQQSVPANSTVTWDPLGPVSPIVWNTTLSELKLQHLASGAGLNFTLIGAN
jgi:hypothetical protein